MTVAAAREADVAPILALDDIIVDFPGVRALDGVSLDICPGEVHGLVGENGAGKSTLIKVMGGVHGHWQGKMSVDGRPVRFSSVAEARAAGVAVVHQELALVSEMTVAENLLLGREPTCGGLVDTARMIADARAMLARFGRAGADIDPEAELSSLGVGQQQIVEIARALGTDARVIVLDEPTAALTDAETERLYEVVRAETARGVAFVYISHRLEEIFALCARITVLRDGRRVTCRDAAELDADKLVTLMIGEELAAMGEGVRRRPGDTVLQVERLMLTDRRGRRVLDDVSLQVRAGEVVALAGAMGSGRTALLSTLFGAARGRVEGRALLGGFTARLASPRDAIAAGIALVPEDRKGGGLVLEMSVGENLDLAALGRYCRAGVIDEAAATRASTAEVRRLGVKTPSLETEVRMLSGGNQQKVVLGKWLMTEPKLLLLDEPTRGVDVGAKAEIYAIVRELVEDGLAVLIASSDLPEIRLLADRVVVLREGAVAGELSREEATEEAILRLAVGGGR